MYFQDCLPALNIRHANDNPAIKSARTQKCRIKYIGAVCCCHNNDPCIFLEAVHLYEKGIEGLFPFVVPTSDPGSPVSSNRIDLIDENNAGRLGFSLYKKVSDPAGAYSYKHFYKIGAAH